MLPQLCKTLVATAVLACASAAQADMLDLLVDVSALQRLVGTAQAVDGTTIRDLDIPRTPDATFVPQTFQWHILLDMDQAETFFGPSGNGVSVPTTSGPTPFTEALTSLPSGTVVTDTLPDVSRGFFETNLNVDDLGTHTTNFAAYSSSSQISQLLNTLTGEPSMRFYGRALNMSIPTGEYDIGNPPAPLTWDTQSLLDQLSSHIGTTVPVAYREILSVSRFLDNNQYEKTVTSIVGSATIRSVTVVPEPGTWALMGLGLAAVAMARRQRQVA